MIEAAQSAGALSTGAVSSARASSEKAAPDAFKWEIEGSLSEGTGELREAIHPAPHSPASGPASWKSKQSEGKQTRHHAVANAGEDAAQAVDAITNDTQSVQAQPLNAAVLTVPAISNVEGQVGTDAGPGPVTSKVQKLSAPIDPLPAALAGVLPNSAADETGAVAKVVCAAAALPEAVEEPFGDIVSHAPLSNGLVASGVPGLAHAPGKVSTQPAQAADAAPGTQPARAEEARVFEASTAALEVGVANPTHGWLRVRAELDKGGAVLARVVVTNAAAAEGLHREVPAISAYLAHEQVAIGSLVVHATGSAAGTQESTAGMTFGFAHGRDGSNGAGGRGQTGSSARASLEGQLPFVAGELAGGFALPAALYAGGMQGGWLSVRV